MTARLSEAELKIVLSEMRVKKNLTLFIAFE